MLIANNWAPQNDSPENEAFLAAWTSEYGNADDVHEIAVSQYHGIMLWAEAARQAGSVENQALRKALEGGVSITGPRVSSGWMLRRITAVWTSTSWN